MPSATKVLRDTLASFSSLKRGWNGYNAPPPSAASIVNARAVLDTMLAVGAPPPDRISPSPMGCVSISRREGRQNVYIEVSDENSLVIFGDDGDPDPPVRAFGLDRESTERMIEEVRVFFGE